MNTSQSPTLWKYWTFIFNSSESFNDSFVVSFLIGFICNVFVILSIDLSCVLTFLYPHHSCFLLPSFNKGTHILSDLCHWCHIHCCSVLLTVQSCTPVRFDIEIDTNVLCVCQMPESSAILAQLFPSFIQFFLLILLLSPIALSLTSFASCPNSITWSIGLRWYYMD